MASSVNTTLELTISDIEQTVQNGLEALRNAPLSNQITAALKFLTPPGYRPIAQLEEDGRKKRSTAAASNWTPETGEIVIYFEPTEPARVQPLLPVHPAAGHSKIRIGRSPSSTPSTAEQTSALEVEGQSLTFDPEAVTPWQIEQCCEALAEAEKAGKAFIALKWFRDQGLTVHGYSWATSPACRQAVLTKAIELGAILTAQIPNPKAPQHPTTTVKLNRESEHTILVTPRFQPIQAKDGASASEILLRDRGRF
jgi:hypothetical protein